MATKKAAKPKEKKFEILRGFKRPYLRGDGFPCPKCGNTKKWRMLHAVELISQSYDADTDTYGADGDYGGVGGHWEDVEVSCDVCHTPIYARPGFDHNRATLFLPFTASELARLRKILRESGDVQLIERAKHPLKS
jgi:hypothetical protein